MANGQKDPLHQTGWLWQPKLKVKFNWACTMKLRRNQIMNPEFPQGGPQAYGPQAYHPLLDVTPLRIQPVIFLKTEGRENQTRHKKAIGPELLLHSCMHSHSHTNAHSHSYTNKHTHA